MKTRIAVGASLLLTLGSAVAGSILYGQGQQRAKLVAPVTSAPSERVTPEMIAQWKQSSRSDYIAPRVPI